MAQEPNVLSQVLLRGLGGVNAVGGDGEDPFPDGHMDSYVALDDLHMPETNIPAYYEYVCLSVKAHGTVNRGFPLIGHLRDDFTSLSLH